MQLVPQVTILIWATDPILADQLLVFLYDCSRTVRVLETDADLATGGSNTSLLVAQAGPRLDAQRVFLRGPLILVDPKRIASRELVAREQLRTLLRQAESTVVVVEADA